MIGGLASMARFVVARAVPADTDAGFPVGTLAVNLSGSFVLGLLAGAGVAGDAYLLAGTAALGSYTTFSTWILDSERLARHGLAGASWPTCSGASCSASPRSSWGAWSQAAEARAAPSASRSGLREAHRPRLQRTRRPLHT